MNLVSDQYLINISCKAVNLIKIQVYFPKLEYNNENITKIYIQLEAVLILMSQKNI